MESSCTESRCVRSRTAALLEAAGLLTTDEDERWLPGRDPGHVSLREILHAARDPRRSVGDAHGALRIPAVDRLREDLQRASDTVCDETKLCDWVEASVPRSLTGDGHTVDQK